MKRKKLYALGTLLLACTALIYHGCATIISSSCSLDLFEGTYVGKYNVGGLIPIPVDDTVIVTVDLEANTALVTSVLLDTSFLTNYLDERNELVIGALNVPVFSLGEDQLFGITVQDGFGTLDGECDRLYLQMNKVSVQDHTFVGIPKPINNLDLTSPNFLRRIN